MPPRKLPPRRDESFRTIAVLTLIPIIGVLLFLAARFIVAHIPAGNAAPVARSTPPPAAAAKPQKKVGKTPLPRRGSIVVILDDVGHERQALDRAMTIDPNLNFAVLPDAGRSTEFAGRLHRHGFEILCHLPMEPRDAAISAGRNAIRAAMSDTEIARVTRQGIAAVPHARGMNNHMGSRASADRRVMQLVLSSIPSGMYFIDSKTVGDSVGEEVARALRVKTASRHVFLDDIQSMSAIRQQLRRLAEVADDRGIAIGIGHMYPETIAVLKSEAPGLRARGYRFVRASEVVQ